MPGKLGGKTPTYVRTLNHARCAYSCNNTKKKMKPNIVCLSHMSMLGYFDVLTLTPAGSLLERLRKINLNFKTPWKTLNKILLKSTKNMKCSGFFSHFLPTFLTTFNHFFPLSFNFYFGHKIPRGLKT